MNGNARLRRTHRWLSVAFTVTVVANFVIMGLGRPPPPWVVYAPLLPLFLLWSTGTYMFARHYYVVWRSSPGAR